MNELTPKGLARVVASKVGDLLLGPAPADEAGYEKAIARVASRVSTLQAELERNRARAEERYADLVDQPSGRRATVLENAQPPMLLALAYDLMRRSYERRFSDTKRSLSLASLAHEVARSVARTDYLSPHTAADLIGEALDHLGNARRINSDLLGAERAFVAAERSLNQGTRDRDLRANHFSFLASQRYTQGNARQAVALFDKEIALRRLLSDPERLGAALLNRGILACHSDGPSAEACKAIRSGIDLVRDDESMLLGLLALAEALARAGDGVQAWKALCMCRLVSGLADLGGSFERKHKWLEGITYRALGELDRSRKVLATAREGFLRADQPLLAAFVALDLLAVLAAQGELDELTDLAETTYREFVAVRLEQPALSVFLILRRAALARRLSEELAIRVANFIVRHQHDRSLRFEGSGDE